eukprot:4201270-Pyramimonas_sp.AAC.1
MICACLHNMCMSYDKTDARGMNPEDYVKQKQIVTRATAHQPALDPNASALQRRMYLYAQHVYLAMSRGEVLKLKT